ncbi:hypothetical protein [Terrimonas pollutisoli]|uniref:hypothetical protein n=1 Tax=Terrimonas pollutisoli TaxID=3034147 RepID=UPI0023EC3EC6|nr:hypothetical protein [Terrimonas sp. H1YJ31]
MKTFFIIMTMLFFSIRQSSAQHEHHQQPKKDTVTTKNKPAVPARDTVKKKQPVKKEMDNMDHSMHDMHNMQPMSSHAFSRNLPMSRNSSGTAWNPDSSPMYMWMKQTGKTDWMFHGNVFLRYTNTDIFNSGNRGHDKLDAPNWFMAMMNRKMGKKGLFNLTAMISLDRLTEGGDGYPLLLQSGETWNGKRLVDRQHPHDLFSGLSIGYTQMINKNIDVFGYVGYPGEPALGAPTFMHRVSSMNNPDAPLGHHWQDATHVTFGVATLGFRYKNFKLEGSSFTGREPDEDRYDFDKARFNSYSYRLSYNPTRNWALQFSQGFIKEPEALEPGVDITRTTASVLYAKSAGADKHYSAALVWGLNDKGEDHKEHSILLENNYQFGKNALFSRYEFLQKSAEELDLEDELGHQTFNVHVFSLGYNRSLFQQGVFELSAGTKATINFPAKELKPLYGDMPVGLQVYLQLRPSLHRH